MIEIEPTPNDLADRELTEIVEDAYRPVNYYRPVQQRGMVSPEEQYLQEIHMIPRLLPEEEVRLFKQAEAEQEASVIRDENGKEIYRMLKRQTSVGERLINSHLRLVASVARRYHSIGSLQFLDLVQAGNIGLMHCIEKFDYTRGFRLLTYATWWIRQAVIRTIIDQSGTIRIPVHIYDAFGQVTHTEQEIRQTKQTNPTDQEVAELMVTTKERIRNLKLFAKQRQAISLETPIGDDENITLGEIIPDKSSESTSEQGIKLCLTGEITKLLGNLTSKERMVVQLRFGMDDGRPKTLEEVGKEMRVSRERARQIEAESLTKLRESEAIEPFREYLST